MLISIRGKLWNFRVFEFLFFPQPRRLESRSTPSSLLSCNVIFAHSKCEDSVTSLFPVFVTRFSAGWLGVHIDFTFPTGHKIQLFLLYKVVNEIDI